MASIPRARALELFPEARPIPGLAYRPDFISAAEEASLLAVLSGLPFRNAEFLQYVARRRVVSYGSSYDFGAQQLLPAPPVPDFLQELRSKVSEWIGLPADELAHALINEYQPGTPLGWHRDRPEFGTVVGVSLGGPARMRFRRYPPGKREKAIALELEPRSAYVMQDEVRWHWQHNVPPTPGLRYSITFRTLHEARALP